MASHPSYRGGLLSSSSQITSSSKTAISLFLLLMHHKFWDGRPRHQTSSTKYNEREIVQNFFLCETVICIYRVQHNKLSFSINFFRLLKTDKLSNRLPLQYRITKNQENEKNDCFWTLRNHFELKIWKILRKEAIFTLKIGNLDTIGQSIQAGSLLGFLPNIS